MQVRSHSVNSVVKINLGDKEKLQFLRHTYCATTMRNFGRMRSYRWAYDVIRPRGPFLSFYYHAIPDQSAVKYLSNYIAIEYICFHNYPFHGGRKL